MQLYYHKTDGGAEYLYDTFIECENGHKEGVVNSEKIESTAKQAVEELDRKEKCFDVVIKDVRSGDVVATIGMNMREDKADKRVRAGMAIIDAGFYIDVIEHRIS